MILSVLYTVKDRVLQNRKLTSLHRIFLFLIRLIPYRFVQTGGFRLLFHFPTYDRIKCVFGGGVQVEYACDTRNALQTKPRTTRSLNDNRVFDLCPGFHYSKT